MNAFALSVGPTRDVFVAESVESRKDWIAAIAQACKNVVADRQTNFLYRKYHPSSTRLPSPRRARTPSGKIASRSQRIALATPLELEQKAIEHELQKEADLTEIFDILANGTLPLQSGVRANFNSMGRKFVQYAMCQVCTFCPRSPISNCRNHFLLWLRSKQIDSAVSNRPKPRPVVKLVVLFHDCLVVLTVVEAPRLNDIQDVLASRSAPAAANSATSGPTDESALSEMIHLVDGTKFVLDSIVGLSAISVRLATVVSSK